MNIIAGDSPSEAPRPHSLAAGLVTHFLLLTWWSGTPADLARLPQAPADGADAHDVGQGIGLRLVGQLDKMRDPAALWLSAAG
jgi:hypothetical protein